MNMIILRYIIIMNAYFISVRVYSIDLLDNVNTSNYKVNIYILNSLFSNKWDIETINVNLYKPINIEIPANKVIKIKILSDKRIFLKEIIIVFDKINILPNTISSQRYIGEQNVTCNGVHRIKSLQNIDII